MSGPEHYRDAELWLFKAQEPGARDGDETAESCAAIANAHATLALAAATALSGDEDLTGRYSRGWNTAAGGAS